MNQESDIYTTCFNECPPIVLVNPQTAGFGNVTGTFSFREANLRHIDLAGAAQGWRSGLYFSDPVEAQQAIPSQPMALQGIVRSVAKVTGSLVSPAREAGLSDPYSAHRAKAMRLIADEGFNAFLVTWSDPPGVTNWAISAGLASQKSEQTTPYHLSEIWDEENDLRFDSLVEKEALGELDKNELDELERLSSKRDHTLARVSDEDWARERERSKALAELQDLLERYAPLFAKRR
jgi:hypothetical protein